MESCSLCCGLYSGSDSYVSVYFYLAVKVFPLSIAAFPLLCFTPAQVLPVCDICRWRSRLFKLQLPCLEHLHPDIQSVLTLPTKNCAMRDRIAPEATRAILP